MNKMMKFNFFLMYISMILLLMMNNFMMKWIIYEFSMILMISMLNIMKNSTKMISILYYSISSLSSIMFMFFLIINNYLNLFSNINLKFLMNFFMLILFLKMSMFPFHNWMIFCYEKSSWQQIFFLSTIMKFIPIVFFCNFLNFWLNLIILLILNSIFMSIYININFSFKKLFACSTSFNNVLMIFIYMINMKQFILFIIMYSIILYFIMNLLFKMNSSKLYIIFNYKFMNYMFKLWILIYSMLPLMLSFMLKWNFLYEMIKFNKFILYLYLLYLLSSLLLMWKYLIILKKFMYMNNNYIYLKINKKMNLFVFLFMNLFIFLFIMFNFMNN
ncbi:NADH dehydrogenase subunit 2 (mitochondrion) [Frieseomelitta varia]|uniref:NADH dehydrogenase subunit 2 n=1 Tax=Frieseomelitta varia TaxID=561572 RepID=A0A833VTV5_9HYME|nr:NADH dehydrogenase subunit 2 [Frieseomelitta varia]